MNVSARRDHVPVIDVEQNADFYSKLDDCIERLERTLLNINSHHDSTAHAIDYFSQL